MIAHYRKSRDKFSRTVAREATELLGEILKLLWRNSEADSRWILIWQNTFAGMNFPAGESSLNGRNSLQGLFSGEGIIPERQKFFAEIIFQWRNHP